MSNTTAIIGNFPLDLPAEKVNEGLHIAAIFIVLFAGFLGVFAPAFLVRKKILDINDRKFIIGKAFSGGVILGTGFIHMLPEAQNQLNESLGDFPFSGFFAGLAAIMSLVIEQIAFEQVKKAFSKMEKTHRGPEKEKKEENKEEFVHMHIKNPDVKTAIIPDSARIDSNVIGIDIILKPCNDCDAQNNEAECVQKRAEHDAEINGRQTTPDTEVEQHLHHHDDDHDHSHSHTHEHNHEHEHDEHGEEGGHVHGAMNLYTNEELCKKANSFTIAHVLEIGIAFHSIIIGITLSVETNATNFHALLIAICFHQLFEGFALGSSIQGAKITSLLHVGIMTAIFSLATPVGQSIGLGIVSLYDSESDTAKETQGVFDSISGGILIYMSLVDLISEDFKKNYPTNMRYLMMLALTLGFCFMTILAIWA